MLDNDSFYDKIGERLRIIRNNSGIDQEALADKLGLSRGSIINMEKGRQRASVYQLWLMAQIFNVPITDFIPQFDVVEKMGEWEGKLDNASTEISEEERKKLLGFIAATQNKL